MATWYSVVDDEAVERLVGVWQDAPVANLELCGLILTTARDQVTAFAPVSALVPDGEPAPDPPGRYIYAQLQQATNLWNAGRASGDGDIGGEGFSFTPRPLDRTIKNIIRPPGGGPRVR